VLAYEAEEKEYNAPEQPGRRRVSSSLAGETEKEEAAGCSGAPAQAEKEAECHHVPEKEAQCPDHLPEELTEEEAECPDSPEEEAVEEAESPDLPEEEEEAEASSSEG
jgi:hypothetical protein